MQGDCLSAVLFIVYLAAALREEEQEKIHAKKQKEENRIKKQTEVDHPYATKEMETEHLEHTNINPKYADDCSYITTEEERFTEQEKTSQKRLEAYHLNINISKTEKFTVPEKTA